ncbi:hypothetical protein Tco_0277072 [Tanacetum coccineum]
MNDFKRNKHFPEKIASNLKFLNNLQPEWSRHVTIVHQTKDLHTTDYTQLYDFLKYNQKEVDDQRAERLAKTHDPLALMANSNNPFNYPVFHQDQPSPNKVVTTAEDWVFCCELHGQTKEEGMLLISRLLLIAQKERRQESNSKLKTASTTSGTQTDNAPVYDSDGSAEVHNYDNCYDNEIFNMFTQEEQYTELLEPIPEPHQEQQNDSNVISDFSCVEQEGGIVDQHPATVEETRAYFESLYNNLALEVEKVNSVNRKMTETNADLTTELARYKNQEKCFEISQEKYDQLDKMFLSKDRFIKNQSSNEMNKMHFT